MKRVTLFILILLLAVSFGCTKKGEQDEIKVKNLEDENVRDEDSKTTTENEKNDIDQNTPQKNVKKSSVEENKYSTQKIRPTEASFFVGKSVIVKGYVASVFMTDKVAYLNFEKKYPDNPLTATIFEKHFSDFDDLTKYENRTIEVKGRVTKYKGKPQIILNSGSQIRIVD